MDERVRGQVDTSDAAMIVIDGHGLKEKSYDSYLDLVDTRFSLSQKSNHELFGQYYRKDVDGELISHEGKELELDDYYRLHANFAIDEFNRIRKDMKLRLVKLFRVNTAYWCGLHLYMTFSALDELSGNTGIYQAAIVPLTRGERVLGLFRDYSNDKILAILSITGDEEDSTASKKACENDYGEPVKSDYSIQLSKCRELKNFTALGLGSDNKTGPGSAMDFGIGSGNKIGSGSAVGLKVLLV